MPKVEASYKTQDMDRRLRLVIAANVLFVSAVLLAWSPAVRIAAGILQWATLEQVSLRGGFFDYPLTLMWELPLAGTVVAWVIRQGGSQALAVWVASFPILYLASIALCYRLVPMLGS